MTKAYYGTHLSLPKSYIKGIEFLKRSLEFHYNDTQIKAWKEDDSYLIVPREFLSVDEYKELPFPVENTNPTDYPELNVQLTYSLRDIIQEKACEALLGGSGLLVLSCGKGKTVVSLHAWAKYKVPALVIVPKLDLAYQWKTRITEHTDITEDEIGWIQGAPDTWKWKNTPIAIAVLKTTALYPEGFTEEFKQHFGIAIYDEVHRLGAPYFNASAGICRGLRWGLSATPFRTDGLDQIYRYHLGPILYANTTQENIPMVYFLQSSTSIPLSEEKKVNLKGELHFAKLVTWLSEQQHRNNVIISCIREAMAKGRTLLVLSDRVEHLKYLQAQIPESGILHGAVKGEDRENILQDNRLVFASTKIAKEGLDKKTLDTVFITTPVGDESTFIQIMGRAQRGREPMVIIVEDEIDMCNAMCNKLRRVLRKVDYPFKKMEVQIDSRTEI